MRLLHFPFVITALNLWKIGMRCTAKKVADADIIYFLGGLPDRMLERIKEYDLYDILLRHDGIVKGMLQDETGIGTNENEF